MRRAQQILNLYMYITRVRHILKCIYFLHFDGNLTYIEGASS